MDINKRLNWMDFWIERSLARPRRLNLFTLYLSLFALREFILFIFSNIKCCRAIEKQIDLAKLIARPHQIENKLTRIMCAYYHLLIGQFNKRFVSTAKKKRPTDRSMCCTMLLAFYYINTFADTHTRRVAMHMVGLVGPAGRPQTFHICTARAL